MSSRPRPPSWAHTPAATAARHPLPVRTESMMFTNSFAAASVLLDALVTEIALHHRSYAADAVASISRVLEADANLVSPPGRQPRRRS